MPTLRKRPSANRLDGLHGWATDSRPDSPWKSDQDRLPVWQAALLTIAAIAALYFVLSLTHPRARAAQALVGKQPKCFPLEDGEAFKFLASSNKAYSRTIATTSAWAQAFFNLGMLAAHGFNQLQASTWFKACLRADPTCAMCFWGLAYAEGPIPNKLPGKLGERFPAFLPTHATDALAHIKAATQHNEAALRSTKHEASLTLREQALIQAMAERYAEGAAALKANKWREHETAYAHRMKQLAEQQQDDADVFALAAEAFMNLTPWDYYDAQGQLRPPAAIAEQLLDKALALNPRHTQALHLHIHITEAGTPGEAPAESGADHPANSAARGLSSAETLAALRPEDGHLLHMPSHTFVRVGQYRRAFEVNKAAYEHDVNRGSQCVVPYLPEHNVNMLVYVASMAGMYHTASGFAKGMRDLRQRVPDTWMAKGDEWVSLPLLYIRYGQMSNIVGHLSAPPQDARGVTAFGGPQFAKVVYHAGRVLALAARASFAAQQLLELDDMTAFDIARKSLALREKEVAHEHKQLKAAVRAVPVEPVTRPGPPPGIFASAYITLANIMVHLVDARLALLHNNTASAVELLSEAVVLEDSLGYMEPPRVHQPVRQCLAWVLLQSKRYEEAAEVYRQDLQQHPNNGWSLLGLKQAAEATGGPDLEAISQRFDQAWSGAEVEISSSCPALSQPFDS